METPSHSQPSSAPPPDALLRPLARLLRPLVRLLIRSGVTFPVLADLLRGLYVEIAVQDLLPDPKARTDSRISLLTGVHRKEIRRQRETELAADAVPEVLTLASQVIARWLGAPAYTDARGAPLPLPRGQAGTAAGVPTFDSLVSSVTRDVRPRTVLDDWVAQGIVRIGPDDLVRLNSAAFIPQPGREEQMFYFARNLHDHIAAASANVVATGTAPFLDRSVHYDRLRPDVAALLVSLGRDAAQRLLLDVNRTALAMADDPANMPADGAPTQRVNLGVYLYAEADPAPSPTLAPALAPEQPAIPDGAG